mmetsp:Transcript_71361/g.128450  ORF Transcript_71361/g.128450 Transcript_71361/m.128450 type:complete len:88 (+) Transcript_71361:1502-1765(+)
MSSRDPERLGPDSEPSSEAGPGEAGMNDGGFRPNGRVKLPVAKPLPLPELPPMPLMASAMLLDPYTWHRLKELSAPRKHSGRDTNKT